MHQLQVAYQAEEDRLVLRVSLKQEDGNLQEVRAWFTRRLVQRLWPAMNDLLQTKVTLESPQAAHAKSEIVSMEREVMLTEMRAAGSFNQPYEEKAVAYPMGEVPMLVHTVNFKADPNQPIELALQDAAGRSIALNLAPALFHAFSELLRDGVKTAEWNLELPVPGTTAPRSTALN
ncbi:hypothetical protein [Noviherbaspirillum galbum]|uniref:Uncharacterized protein n=1 Tax=Noviherbaspirillum galbum TaxID=2709383 RepID=A0A6B3SQ83_9BURK|nr:hypothetical protein [Noviherbaspirillum galbum]NEX59869.1 hypothetical protein [Noviherbaspirillum galbum]